MTKEIRVKVHTEDEEQYQIWTLPGSTVWDALENNGFNPGGQCGGRGVCGKCGIRVEGKVSPPAEEEIRLLDLGQASEGYRLACHCLVLGEAEVYLPENETSRSLPAAVVKRSQVELSPGINKVTAVVSGLAKEKPKALWERVQRVFPELSIDLTAENWNLISSRDDGRELVLTGITSGSRVLNLTPEEGPRVLGVALDIGTTSLFAALVDLITGEELAVAARSNPQRVYGADVLSRVSYTLEEPSGLQHLHAILVDAVNSMLEAMAREAGSSPRDIYQVVVVGNPVMLHLLAGFAVTGFARAPFTGVFSHELALAADKLSLYSHPSATVWVLPQIGGFVGADTVAGLLAVSPSFAGTFLFIDIGTNSEMVLHNQGQWWACSAAAGPAFEGGNISRGIRAQAGAIDRVWEQDGLIKYGTLGGNPPRGICGSGLVDLVAVLLEQGYLDATGLLLSKSTSGQGSEFVLVPATTTASGQPIGITQKDIRQLQLAKGAVRAAVDIMLERAGLTPRDVDRVFLAGAFGNCLHPDSLLRIGLLPTIDVEKIKRIGNAAISGAVLALLSEHKREEARWLAQRIEYIELADQPDFQEIFLRSLNFGK